MPEIWATRLTLGLVKSKLDEHGLLRAAELREADPDAGPIDLGPFRIEFIRMAHSVPDAVGARDRDVRRARLPHRRLEARPHARSTGSSTDVGRLAELGNRGVDLLLGRLDERRAAGLHALGAGRRRGVPPDHPGAQRPRPRLAAFASNIHRMQQAIDVAVDDAPQGRRRRPLDAQAT